MTNVLVAYASKHGSTEGIAQAIAQSLRESGVSADCRRAGEVRSLEPYDAVVLGSAVYIKRWRREAKRFLGRHERELIARPFWVFSSGPIGDPANDEGASGWLEPQKIVDTVERLRVRDHVVFGGRVPSDSRFPPHRDMVENTPPEYRDRRDWDEIRAWAASIAEQLRPDHAAPRAHRAS
jgi:menaquinone-dependent protoporphyrinogen oxidase